MLNTKGGESVEVGVTGKEGFNPIPAAAVMRHSPHKLMTQVSGNGFRMPVEELQALQKSTPQFEALLYRHATVHGLQTAQTAGRNRLHDLRQCLARWLLLVRTGSALAC